MHIHLVTTGGTIDKVYFDAQSSYEVGEPQVDRMLQQANVTFDYDVTTLFRKDSLDLTDEDRQAIVEAVRELSGDRVVVTHGTDTMVETARALRDGVDGKVVALVGALNPSRFRDSDAFFNVGFAMAAVQTLSAGVYITMNGRVLAPEHARKNRNANRFETT